MKNFVSTLKISFLFIGLTCASKVSFSKPSQTLVEQFNNLTGTLTWGILSTEKSLEQFEKDLPVVDYSKKDDELIKTFNNLGHDTVDATAVENIWIVLEILSFSKNCKLPILDIGGGFGRLAKFMLRQDAVVVFNDLDPRHLMYGRGLATPEERKRLYLNAHLTQ